MSESVAYWPEFERNPAYTPVRPDYGMGMLIKASMGQVWNDNPTRSLYRAWSIVMADESDLEEGAPKLSVAEANKRFGVPDRLTFDEPVSEFGAILMHQRKLAEMERENIIETSATWGRAPARFVTSMAAFAADPINLVSMYIPFDKIRFLAPIIGSIKNPIARVAAEEAMVNVVGQLAVEPFTLTAAAYDGEDYDALHNSLVNVGLGAVMGAGVGAFKGARLGAKEVRIKTATDNLQNAAKIMNTLSTQEQNDLLRMSVMSVMRDEPINPAEILKKTAPEVMARKEEAQTTFFRTLSDAKSTTEAKVLAARQYLHALEQTRRFSTDPHFDEKMKLMEERLANLIEGKEKLDDAMLAQDNTKRAQELLDEHRANQAKQQAEDNKKKEARKVLDKEKRVVDVDTTVAKVDNLVPDARPEGRAATTSALVQEARTAINAVSAQTTAIVDKEKPAATPKLDHVAAKEIAGPKPTVVKPGERYSMVDTPVERSEIPREEPSRVQQLTVHNVHFDGFAPVPNATAAEKGGLQKFFHDLPGGSQATGAGLLGRLQGYPLYRRVKASRNLHPGVDSVGINVNLYKVLDLTQSKDSPAGVLAEVLGYDLNNPSDLALLRENIAKDPDYVGNYLRKKGYDGLIMEKDTDLFKSDGSLLSKRTGERGSPSMVIFLGNRRVVVDQTRVKVKSELRVAQYKALGNEATIVEALNRDLSRLLYEENATVFLCDKEGHRLLKLEEVQSGKYQGWTLDNLESQVQMDRDRIAYLEAQRAKILDAKDSAQSGLLEKLQRERAVLEKRVEAAEYDAQTARENGETVDADMFDKEVEDLNQQLDTKEGELTTAIQQTESKYDPVEARRLDLEIEALRMKPRREPGYVSPSSMDWQTLIGWLRKDGFFAVETNPTKLSVEESYMAKQAAKVTRGVRTIEDVTMALVRPEDEKAALAHRAALRKLARLYNIKDTRGGRYIGDVKLSKRVLQAEKKMDRLRGVTGGAMRDPMGMAMGDALAKKGLTDAPVNLETRGMSREQLTDEASKLLREAQISDEIILPADQERVDVAHMMSELGPEQKRQWEIDQAAADDLEAREGEMHEVEAMDLSPEERKVLDEHMSIVDEPDYETYAAMIEDAASCVGKRLGM